MKPLVINFSGGRTSAYMLKRLLQLYKEDRRIEVVFANTGAEHPETLVFVDAVSAYLGVSVTWVEYSNCPEGFKVVDFKSASRNSEPYIEAVRKYGLFNPINKACTRETKLNPMRRYLRSIGLRKGDYEVAVGIRSDEVDRVKEAAKKDGVIYPLVNWRVDKRQVSLELKKWPVQLGILNDAFGNCVWCWKKTKRKLLTVAKQMPDAFLIPILLESIAPDRYKGEYESAKMYRKGMDIERDIINYSSSFEDVYLDDAWLSGDQPGLFDELDTGSACGDSCEIESDE